MINRKWVIDDMELLSLLSEADQWLGRLDTFSNFVPNIDLFIQMHITKEATYSSKIEGTRTIVDDMVLEEEDMPIAKRDDWQEVQNYITAMNAGMGLFENLPFSSRIITEIRKILLQGVRGKNKQPGEYRTSQNWIGGANIKQASFIPPVYHSVPNFMSDLEKFIHNDSIHIPELIRIGIVHYQFETIHPFLDGNGRTGRIMIPLYLISKGIIKKPILYLSHFLESNRSKYYQSLTDVRTKNSIQFWLKFFLQGIVESARDGVETFEKILNLHEKTRNKTLTRKDTAKLQIITDQLYIKPMITAQKVIEITGVSRPTAYRLIETLVELDILIEKEIRQRRKTYYFEEYLQLFR